MEKTKKCILKLKKLINFCKNSASQSEVFISSKKLLTLTNSSGKPINFNVNQSNLKSSSSSLVPSKKMKTSKAVTAFEKLIAMRSTDLIDPSLIPVDQPSITSSLSDQVPLTISKERETLISVQKPQTPNFSYDRLLIPVNEPEITSSFPLPKANNLIPDLCEKLNISASQTNIIPQPLINKTEFSSDNFNSKGMLKHKKAMEIILNCEEVFDITYVLKQNLSSQTYLTLNNYEHRNLFCQWSHVRGRKSKFKVSQNTSTNKNVVHLFNEYIIDKETVNMELKYQQYKAKCGNDFLMQVFFTEKLKLIHFIGKKPNCKCINKNQQKIAFLSNKDKSVKEIYLLYPNLFKDQQEVSNLKHNLGFFRSKKQ